MDAPPSSASGRNIPSTSLSAAPTIARSASRVGIVASLILMSGVESWKQPLPFAPNATDRAEAIEATASSTVQDFDAPGKGTPYWLGINNGTASAQVLPGGPTGAGNLLRLAYTATIPSDTWIVFSRTHVGAAEVVIVDFDFRITTGSTRADGIGFALLNTSVPGYGTTGPVTPGPYVAEEPNFQDSIGVGFDIYQSGVNAETNNNHVSIHFDGQELKTVTATQVLDLASGQWTHARIELRPGGGHSDMSVVLSQCGSPAVTLIDRYPISGFLPYEGRAFFAARSGGESADHDIDNVRVQFLSATESTVAFASGCYSVAENETERFIAVTRGGVLTSTVFVTYTTVNGSATADADYPATQGLLTFASNETTKLIRVQALDDDAPEGAEDFRIVLGDPVNATLGGPAVARVVIDQSAEQKGHWGPLANLPIVPIHMSLLPNGNILMWDRHDADNTDGDPRIWDLTRNSVDSTGKVSYDLFCSGHSFLPDGRLFVSGGHVVDNVGRIEASIFDPSTGSWSAVPDMNAGRWYPSNLTLANGDVLVMGGTITTETVNTLAQVWQAGSNTWRTLTNVVQAPPAWAAVYPWTFPASSGQVFVAGPQQMARYLDVSGSGSASDVASSSMLYRDYGSAVMYGNNKIMIVGGNPQDQNVMTPTIMPSASAEVIDLSAATPSWSLVPSMSKRRRQLNATALPDGTVLVTGGSSLTGFNNYLGQVLEAELYSPISNTWSVMAAHQRYRGYHSNALLLPDGRVMIAGGGHPNPAGGAAEKNAEIYSPPYLFRGPRPTVCAPARITHGQPFVIITADTIAKVTLIRLPSVTHSFNQNQAFHEVSFTQTSGVISATLPANVNEVPLGHYMLFALNNQGVPSLAQIVQVGSVHQAVPVCNPRHMPLISRGG